MKEKKKKKKKKKKNDLTWHIGSVAIKGKACLAPMAGVSDIAYRLLAKEQGAALVCTEMVSAMGIHYTNQRTEEMLYLEDRERPVSMQLFGSNPEVMAEGAKKVEAAGADIVDVNMGCPVKKIVSSGDGSALMQTPELAEKIIEAMVKAVSIPVTVKLRLGWDETTKNIVAMAKGLEKAGAAAIAVHGRTKMQMYSGQADWTYIKEVKEAVSIPVLGNGDIFMPEVAKQRLEESGVDGLLIGRGAQGNPWIFKRINQYLGTGELLPEPSFEERLAMLRKHYLLLVEYKNEVLANREIRTHAGWYIKGLPQASKWRNLINTTRTTKEFLQILDAYETALAKAL